MATPDWRQKFGADRGPNHNPRYHQGTDYGAPIGTPIYAVADCTITNRAYNASAGHYLATKTVDGIWVIYMHLSRIRTTPDKVKRGTIIGYVGNSGNATGPCLHLEFRDKSSQPFDSAPYIRAHLTETVRPATITAFPINDKEKNQMLLCYIPKGAANGDSQFLLFGPGFYLEFVGQEAANGFNKQIGGVTPPVTRSFFNAVKRAVDAQNGVATS